MLRSLSTTTKSRVEALLGIFRFCSLANRLLYVLRSQNRNLSQNSSQRDLRHFRTHLGAIFEVATPFMGWSNYVILNYGKEEEK